MENKGGHFKPILAADDRVAGTEKDEVVVVLQGGSKLPYEDRTLQTMIVYHSSYECFEAIIFFPEKQSDWCRFYFLNKTMLRKISDETLSKAIEDQHELAKRTRRHLAELTMRRNATFVLIQYMIVQALPDLVNYEISRQFIKDQAETSDVLHDLCGRALEYRPYYGDSIALISPKPECLVPVNIDPASRARVQAEYLRSEKTRKNVISLMQGFRDLWSRTLMPQEKPKGQKQAGAGLVKGASAGVAALLAGEVRRKPTVRMQDTPDDPAASQIVRPLQREQSMFLKLSALRRRASGDLSEADGDLSPLPPGASAKNPTVVSLPRFRWIRAIDRVLTRQMHAKVVRRLEEVEAAHSADLAPGSVATAASSDEGDSGKGSSKARERLVRAGKRLTAVTKLLKPSPSQTPSPTAQNQGTPTGGTQRKRMSVVAVTPATEEEVSVHTKRRQSVALVSSRAAPKELQQAQGGWRLNRTPLVSSSAAAAAAAAQSAE